MQALERYGSQSSQITGYNHPDVTTRQRKMDKDNLLNLLGALDQTPLAALSLLDQQHQHQHLHQHLHLHQHQHQHQQQQHVALNHLLSGDFEPTPINEDSMSNRIHQARLAASSFPPAIPPNAVDESMLLRHILNQANNAMDPDHDILNSGNNQSSLQEEAKANTNVVDGKGQVAITSANAQSGRWYERYQDLVKFKAEFGHCCVPSHWPRNPPLAQWVKRQRHQYKRSKEGVHSTITPARVEALNKMSFVWDPHSAFWEERLNELYAFRETHGHCNVPTKFPENPQLAIWAKCQRRQFKLFCTDGPKRSNMTLERIAKLSRVGFVFNPRQAPKRR
jgi:hypothetical protein